MARRTRTLSVITVGMIGRESRSVALLILCAVLLFAASLLSSSAWAVDAYQDGASTALQARYAALKPALARSPLGRQLYLESSDGPRSLQGDVYAVMDAPAGVVSAALRQPQQWCEILILHLNVKYCRHADSEGEARIDLRMGTKFSQPLASATRVRFAFVLVSSMEESVAVELRAPDGPFDTRNYRVLLEVAPVEDGKTLIHFRYSLDFGALSHMSMRAYLATAGRDKVGFTREGEPPRYIRGMRGLVERNTMRYYLAIEAFLHTLSTPAAGLLESRLRYWYDATEMYAAQLHEIEREPYLSMKRAEYQRQQTPQ